TVRRSQPSQNRFHSGSGASSNSTSVLSEQVGPEHAPNGLPVAARKVAPELDMFGSGGFDWPLSVEPGVRQVRHSEFQYETTDADDPGVSPQCEAVMNSMRRSPAVLLTSEPVQSSEPPSWIAPTARRGSFHGSSSARQATSMLQRPEST